MERYKILFRKSVARDMRRISTRDLRRILAVIDALSDDPRPAGCERLSGQDRHRLREGDYRIIYEIKDDEVIVVVVKNGHRKDVYRRR